MAGDIGTVAPCELAEESNGGGAGWAPARACEDAARLGGEAEARRSTMVSDDSPPSSADTRRLNVAGRGGGVGAAGIADTKEFLRDPEDAQPDSNPPIAWSNLADDERVSRPACAASVSFNAEDGSGGGSRADPEDDAARVGTAPAAIWGGGMTATGPEEPWRSSGIGGGSTPPPLAVLWAPGPDGRGACEARPCPGLRGCCAMEGWSSAASGWRIRLVLATVPPATAKSNE